jgi:CBS domain containing-hemolysin-like protein
MLLLAIIVLSALGVSAICSVLEASLLSSSPVELSQRKDAGDAGAARLLRIKEHSIDDAISAILTYNTIAHTVGAALSGAQAAFVFGDRWVGLFSGVLTLLILVFTEIIPKTVGTVYADRLAGFSGWLISLMIKPPMKWLLYLTRALTRLIARGGKKSTTRGDVVAMIKFATRDGALAKSETELLSNLLRFQEIKVQDVMTPRSVITMFEAAMTVDQALEEAEIKAFSRVPIFTERRDNIEGYVLVRELLEAAIDEARRGETLTKFLRPITFIDETKSVGEALRQLLNENEQFGVVLDDLGVVSGLVSLEDLFETFLGSEIIDEFDQVVDLRQKALELRDKRLARIRERWHPREVKG